MLFHSEFLLELCCVTTTMSQLPYHVRACARLHNSPYHGSCAGLALLFVSSASLTVVSDRWNIDVDRCGRKDKVVCLSVWSYLYCVCLFYSPCFYSSVSLQKNRKPSCFLCSEHLNRNAHIFISDVVMRWYSTSVMPSGGLCISPVSTAHTLPRSLVSVTVPTVCPIRLHVSCP
jgi:hypothetical protein